MSKLIYLYREGKQILGSDGIMRVDGRSTVKTIPDKVIVRNLSLEKNFPNKVADGFTVKGTRETRIYNL